MTAMIATGNSNCTAPAEYPSAERQGCGYAIQFLKWVTGSGVAMEIGPDALSVLVAIVTQEDAVHYSRAVNFFNEQLTLRCGIQSTHALIRARQRAIDAGLLHYATGTKRKPGTYWVTGFTAQSASNQNGFTAQSASKPKRIRNQNDECSAESASNPQTSIPNTQNNPHPIPIKNSARFVPPTKDEVRAYCSERKNKIDADQFVDYYESNGWKRGRTSMKDWRAAVRTWERNGFQSSGSPKRSANVGPGVNFDATRGYADAKF
jgi:hypothetical protein